MKIEHYSFGRIVIEGREYTSDVIIYPNRVDPSWWRKQGHFLQVVDLTDVMDAKPSVLIIGTGYHGVMEVPKETLEFLKSKGIEVHTEKTAKAVELYNELSQKRPTIAALHLTC
ncbi:MAG: Mth938-like domain-containing protein [Nitrospirae bacterium]|nr:Mth938-like domain-containing protein [Nitrospirota bacterium]